MTIYDSSASDRLVPGSATIDCDTGQASQRIFRLTLRSNDGRYLPGPLGYAFGGDGSPIATGLAWFNVRYRPWVDLRTGFDSSGNPVYDRTYLGIFVLTQPAVDANPVQSLVTLSLSDKSALLMAPNRITAANIPTFSKGGHTVGGYAKGSTFDAAMADLALKGGVPAAKQNFEPSTLTLPADWPVLEGDDYWQHLTRLAGSMAHILYFNGSGNLVRRDHPLYLANIPSAYTFAPGASSITSRVGRVIDLANVYNHVIALGANSQTALVRGEAQVTSPQSPYHKNIIGERVVFVGKDGALDDMTPDPAISTIAQAQKRAQVTLAQHLGRQESISIEARQIPALEPYDRITVSVPAAGVNLDFFIDKISWTLGVGAMKVEAARWFPAGS